jgi:hypothetical protein
MNYIIPILLSTLLACDCSSEITPEVKTVLEKAKVDSAKVTDSTKQVQTNVSANDVVYDNDDSIFSSLDTNHSFAGSAISANGKDTFEISGIVVRFIANKMLFYLSVGSPDCTGLLCGLAKKIEDNEWRFYFKDEFGETSLVFEFKKIPDTLIDVTENGRSPFHGVRCTFNGTYIKDK